MREIVIWIQAFCAGETLRRAVDSVLAQTYPHFQYDLLDNGADVDTWDIIQAYAAKDSRIVPLRNERNYVCAGIDHLPPIFMGRNWRRICCWGERANRQCCRQKPLGGQAHTDDSRGDEEDA